MTRWTAGAADGLAALAGRGMRPGIAHVRALLDRLGAPDRRYPILLVGGTNAKGSVASMCASALGGLGLRVGLFTSPHLVDVRERFVLDGAPIPPDEFDDLWARLGPTLEAAGATYFEATAVLAFARFAEAGADAAVVEVGMGGRLDATNAADPLTSVVTRVALDHTEHLGPTVGHIAREKAAIARAGRPLVTGAGGTALEVIRAEAARIGARLAVVGEPARAWRTALRGPHQAANAEIALAAVRAFTAEAGIAAAEADLVAGIEAARLPGRFDVIRADPPTVLDGAHNPDGAAALAAALEAEFPGRRWTAVVHVRAPRDARAVAAPVAPLVDRWIVPPLADGAARPPADLAASLAPLGPAETAPSVAAALHRASGGPAVIFGSLYLAGEVLRVLADSAARPARTG